MKKYFASSELIINEDGSVFHLHVKPEWLADKIILVGDPGRVALVGLFFLFPVIFLPHTLVISLS